MLLLVASALAGPFVLDDPAHRLDAAAEAELRVVAEGVPFPVHAVVDDTAVTEAKLAADAKSLREKEGGLVVAVDPQHRHTAVELDAAVGVRRAAFDDVRKAGNASFREGRWGAGLAAIVKEAEARRGDAASASGGASPPPRFRLTDVVIAGIGLTGLLLLLMALREKRGANRLYTDDPPMPPWEPPRSRYFVWRDPPSGSSSDSGGSSSGASGGSSGSW